MGEAMHEWGQGVYGNSAVTLSSAVNLKLF